MALAKAGFELGSQKEILLCLVLLFFFSGLQWIKKYLLPLHSSDKQVKAGRNEERIPYGNGISVLHTFWNLVHGDMLAFDLKALNVSGHCRNSRYK